MRLSFFSVTPKNSLRHRGKILAISIAGFLGACCRAHADVPPDSMYHARRWLVDDGLPHNVVNRIEQDDRGFLWIANSAGLARFDGREFREYALPTSNAEGSPNIRDLVIEKDSTLLMLPSGGGIVRFHEGVFSDHPATSAVAGRQLLHFFPEPDGSLWLGGGDASLMRWHEGKLTTFGADDGYVVRRAGGRHCFARDRDGRVWISCGDFLGWYRDEKLVRVPLDTRSSIIIAAARSGGIWVATDERLLKWQDGELKIVAEASNWVPPTAVVQQVFEDRSGTLWVGTRREGLFRIAEGNLASIPSERSQISAITQDAESNIWVAMNGGGISRLRRKTFVLFDTSSGLPDDNSTSVCEDASGVIWCADRRNGLVGINGRQIQVLGRTAPQPPVYASNVCPDMRNNLWIGSINGLYQLPSDRASPIKLIDPAISPVRALFCARSGDMWVAYGNGPTPGYQLGYFRDGAFHSLTRDEGFQGKHVVAITEAADHAIWIGTFDGEILEFHDGKLETRVPNNPIALGAVHSLHFDATGALWIGSERGLSVKTAGSLRHFTKDEGLPGDAITQIQEDDRRHLWFCNRRGFFSASIDDLNALSDRRTGHVFATSFGKDEGLPGVAFPTGGQPMSWKGHDGRLWFVTTRGIVSFDPTASLPPRKPPPVLVDDTLVDGRAVTGEQRPLRIPSGDHRVEFRFVAFNYSAPEKIRLRHQLVGFDANWIETNQDRSAGYSQLAPGSYTLRVTAADQDGRWNEQGSTVALLVVPAWYQTWWWKTIAVVVFSGLVASGARYWSHRRLKLRLERLEREHALEKERARIARDLHDDLGGSLTQIGLLAERLNLQANSPELEKGLNRLAHRSRRLANDLESIVWTVSPKNNTWDRLASYLTQYAQRFFRETAIGFTVEGVEKIPPLPLEPELQHHVLAVMKEVMTNVLKHSQASSVRLVMDFQVGVFEFSLRDSGIGFDPQASEHAERNGLANMQSRMAEIGGTVQIVSAKGAGTTVVIRIPQPPKTQILRS